MNKKFKNRRYNKNEQEVQKQKGRAKAKLKKPDINKNTLPIVLVVLFFIFAVGIYIGGYVAQGINHIVANLFRKIFIPDYSFAGILDFAFRERLGIFMMLGTDLLLIMLAYLMWKNKKLFHGGKYDKDNNVTLSEEGTYGTAMWIDRDELDETFDLTTIDKAKGTIFGKVPSMKDYRGLEGKLVTEQIPEYPENHNTLVLGPAGRGKTRYYIMPHILQSVRRGESVIVTDPKGELYDNMSKFLEQHGYIVKVFNVINEEQMQHSDSWNPFTSFVDRDGNVLPERVKTFVNIYIANQQATGGTTELFWTEQATQLFTAEIIRQLEERKKNIETYGDPNAAFTSIGSIYKKMIEDGADKLASDYASLKNKGEEASKAYDNARGFASNRENKQLLANIFSGFITKLQDFTSDSFRHITARPEIDLTMPAKQKCAYFVIIDPVNNTKQYLTATFFSLLFESLMETAMENHNVCLVPVNVLMDEFANLGMLPNFDKVLSVMRGYDIRVSMVVQSIAQLKTMYQGTDTWEVLATNCEYIDILGVGNVPSQLKFVSDLLGVSTAKSKSARMQRNAIKPVEIENGYMESQGDVRRMLMNPDEIARLKKGKLILYKQGSNPIKLDAFKVNDHPDYARLIKRSAVEHIPDWKFEASYLDVKYVSQKEIARLRKKLNGADKETCGRNELPKGKDGKPLTPEEMEKLEQERQRIEALNRELEIASAKTKAAAMLNDSKGFEDYAAADDIIYTVDDEKKSKKNQTRTYIEQRLKEETKKREDLAYDVMRELIPTRMHHQKLLVRKRKEMELLTANKKYMLAKPNEYKLRMRYTQEAIDAEQGEIDYLDKIYRRMYDIGKELYKDNYTTFVEKLYVQSRNNLNIPSNRLHAGKASTGAKKPADVLLEKFKSYSIEDAITSKFKKKKKGK